MKLSLITLLTSISFIASAQIRFVDFNTSIPSNWSTTGASPLSLSNEHYKDGGQSLKWTATNGNQLRAIDLNIPSSEIGNTTSGSAQIFIYSKEVSNDTLIFQFFDNAGVKRREGRMLLNYKGWRDYHRSYYYDYNNEGTMAGFLLNQCIIIYKPQQITSTKTIYFDAVRFVGDIEVSTPGPHMALDYQHFRKNSQNGQNGNALASWLNGPDIPIDPASTIELAGLNTLRIRFLRPVGNVSVGDLSAAKGYVANCSISRNTDNSIKGRGIIDLNNADTLVLLSTYCGYLARAYINNNDTDARDKLLLFTEYLLDQGLAEGGRNVLRTNSYANARDFPIGFLEAMNVYPTGLRADVMKMLKWSHQFNIVYGADYIPGYNVDFLNLKSKTLFELALAEPDDAAARDLKCVKRFMERNTEPALGARDGMKPDGLGYHHQSHHVSYMTAWGVWIDLVHQLRGTAFKINQQAYENMGLGIKSLFLATSEGTVFSHAESGRTPFQNSVPISLLNFRKFVEIGGDIKGLAADPEMGGVYNYITGTSTYSVPTISLDGSHQFNYGSMGVHRKSNWTAVMRGFTSKIFGAEINAGDNRWGRYQSYGSLEVLYGGSLAASGYIRNGDGWDWNVMPGTTTVHFPSYTGLLALRPTSTEYQLENFAGGLSLGENGVFGMDFSQDSKTYYTTSNLKFKKSVFAFDNIMVCLGSNISTGNSLGNVATNLFQAINTSNNPAIYVNSTSPTSGTYNNSLSTSSSGIWLLNAQTTGYYIPQGNGDVTIFRGAQSTPLESSDDANVTATANASKAWINHGTHPSEGKYHYVVVPGTTAQNMESLISQIDGGLVYDVLMQTAGAHIVKYLPKKITSYAFFQPQTDVNVGYVKSISNKALVGVKEAFNATDVVDSLIVIINIPDLNTENKTSLDYYWLARPSTVSLTLNGGWDIAENLNNATITKNGSNLTATFVLEHGFSNTIKLVREGVSDEPGKWVLDSDSLIYNLGTGTGVHGTSWTNGVSLSGSSSPGFLPYPSQGTGRVSSSTGSPRFDLEGSGESAALKITASFQGTIGKFSLYNTGASAVTALFFKMSFNTEPNNGNWLMAIGNHLAHNDNNNRFNDASGVPSTERTEIFSALRWSIGTGNSIDFAYRQKSGSTISYATVNGASFVKGGTYNVEVYCNNSDGEQDYNRGSENYTVDAGTLHVWVDGIRLGVFPASELVRKKELTAFLFTGNNSNLPAQNSAQLTLSGIQLHYVKHSILPVTVTSFTGNYNQGNVVLKWSTVYEKNVDLFKIYRSTDGENYSYIGNVPAVGSSSQETFYSFTDSERPVNNQHVYYKMVSLDKDGEQSYSSDVVVIKLPFEKEPFKIIPNPVKDKMELRFYAATNTITEIRISSADGKMVHHQQTALKEGYNTIIIDVSFLTPGVYVTALQGVIQEKGVFIKY